MTNGPEFHDVMNELIDSRYRKRIVEFDSGILRIGIRFGARQVDETVIVCDPLMVITERDVEPLPIRETELVVLRFASKFKIPLVYATYVLAGWVSDPLIAR